MHVGAVPRLLSLALLACGLAHSTTVQTAPVSVEVTVNDQQSVQELDEYYQGYNIDSGSLYHNIQLDNAVLQQLVRNLAPAQLRIGGSASDSLWYVPDGQPGPGPSPDPLAPNFASTLSQPWFNASLGYVPEVSILTDSSWRSITGFAKATGTQLLWDVNAVDFRTPNGAWSPANVSSLFAYTAANDLQVAAWELGNEPDLWVKHFNLSVSESQQVSDLRTLQAVLSAFKLSTAVFGPSLATFNATTVQQYIQAWMATGGGQLGFTAHAYPLGPPIYPNGSQYTPWSIGGNPSCSVNNYFNRTRVNNLAWYLGNFSAVIAQYGDPASTRMVLEETASNSLGGCVGYSDRFISGFYFMNVLGIVAESGWQQINRQDLCGMSFTSGGSQYTLFGPPGWTNGTGLVPPHPDYFTAILWRKLMGRTVMNNTLSGDTQALFTSHVWCSAETAPGVGRGMVTLAYTNAYNTSVAVTVSSTTSGAPYTATPRSEFFMTGQSLTGYPVYLNNRMMRVDRDGKLPPELMAPRGRLVTDAKQPLVVPAQSYGFVVFHAADVGVCIASVDGASSNTHAGFTETIDITVIGVSLFVFATFALMARMSAARRHGDDETRVELSRSLKSGAAGGAPSYGAVQ